MSLPAKVTRFLCWSALAVYVVAAVVLLGLRYWVLPNIDQWRPRIEAYASEALGARVEIGRLQADWRGLNPRLKLTALSIYDQQPEPVLTLPSVSAVLGWRSVLLLSPSLLSLRIDGPELRVRRDAGDRLWVHAHVDESLADAQIHNNVHIAHYEGFKSPVAKFGVFLKSAQSVVGASQGVRIAFPGRRNDHEVELAVVIGKQGKDIKAADAMAYVAGYCIGLDMTVRGTEDRSYRKSADSYTVLGPWLVTADEIADAGNLDFSIEVNGEPRQRANTRDLITGIAELIEVASHVYTLYPGDVIMTGTPEGVNTVQPGDVMHARIEGLGEMDVAVR